VLFFDSWPIAYWFEPKVVPHETLLTRAGFISIRHWFTVLVFAMVWLAIRLFPVGRKRQGEQVELKRHSIRSREPRGE
jgi:hypothetical protein